ncbi:MAG TPA: aminotransferase class V-fold PLP-dependent enzyme [Bryobacteraceae bacterium]|jgi:selenocysteine lyase/cysteine desulfurase|nr:aminotransferase class V-fold PLP-dependent enzyme [Bryobacteraceae bacterium]
MISPIAWKLRTFSFDLPVGAFPEILERLGGTPCRATELVTSIPEDVLATRVNGKWSAKEHLGHLADLGDLDDLRLGEFLAHSPTLSAADMENTATENAAHNRRPISVVLNRLRAHRAELVRKLELLTEDQIAFPSLHPRLQKEMRLVDWAYFVAEHDDHHLALARQCILELRRTKIATSSARELFEIPDGVTYLNCANMAPQMRVITDSGIRAVQSKATPWRLSDWFAPSEELRTLAARVMGTSSDAIALIPAASYGIAIAAKNLPFSAGQQIVGLDQEFPSNVYAWRELAKANSGQLVQAKREPGESWTGAVMRSINDKTAIVAVPQCHWTDGSKIDLEQIGDRARALGAALVVDASQSLGASVLNLDRIKPDFLTAVGYKWLLGPYGLGYLYVAPRWRDTGIPLEQSWLTRAGSEDFTRLVEYTDHYRPGARRFDMGEFPQFVATPMAIAALQQVLSWGVASIQQALSVLTGKVAQLSAEIGYAALPAPERCGHMIGIRRAGGIPASLSQALRDANVFVSVRGDSIRIAPHLYNDVDDVERLFEVLRTLPPPPFTET